MAEQWLEDEFNLTDKDMENFREALLKYTNPSAIKIIGIFGLPGMKNFCKALDLIKLTFNRNKNFDDDYVELLAQYSLPKLESLDLSAMKVYLC